MFGWAADSEDFTRAVAAVIRREFDGAVEIREVDGRGGDGGIDMLVRDGTSIIVFQFKHFPGGFSASLRQRRQQITSSFRRACTNVLGLTHWVLVVPCALTPGEREFVEALTADPAAKPGLVVAVWDRNELDSRLAKHPDLAAYLQRNEVMLEHAKVYNREIDVLAGGLADLTERFRALRDLGDTLHSDWGCNITATSSGIAVVFHAKHATADTATPIRGELRISTDKDEDEGLTVAEQLKEAYLYGFLDPIEISGENLESFNLHVPREFGISEQKPNLVTYMPSVGKRAGETVAIECYDSAGRRTSSHAGVIVNHHTGESGSTLRVAMHECLTITLTVKLDAKTADATCNVHWAGKPVATGLVAAEAMLGILQADRVSLTLGELPLTFHPHVTEANPALKDTRLLVEALTNLNTVQRVAHTQFPAPNELSGETVEALQIAAGILSGIRSPVPDGALPDPFTVPLHGHRPSPLDDWEAKGESRSLLLPLQYTLEVGNHTVELPDCFLHVPSATLEARTFNGEVTDLTFAVGEGEPVVAYLPQARGNFQQEQTE